MAFAKNGKIYVKCVDGKDVPIINLIEIPEYIWPESVDASSIEFDVSERVLNKLIWKSLYNWRAKGPIRYVQVQRCKKMMNKSKSRRK